MRAKVVVRIFPFAVLLSKRETGKRRVLMNKARRELGETRGGGGWVNWERMGGNWERQGEGGVGSTGREWVGTGRDKGRGGVGSTGREWVGTGRDKGGNWETMGGNWERQGGQLGNNGWELGEKCS